MKTCEKCKRQESPDKGFFLCGIWHCDKCAGSCDYCGASCFLNHLLNGMCSDCQYILDDYEMDSFEELFW